MNGTLFPIKRICLSPSGETMLLDCGPTRAADRIYSFMRQNGIKNFEDEHKGAAPSLSVCVLRRHGLEPLLSLVLSQQSGRAVDVYLITHHGLSFPKSYGEKLQPVTNGPDQAKYYWSLS